MSFSQRVESSGEKDVKRIAVVGRGMIGSSIFKYLSKTVAGGGYKCEFEIYCIGPDEHPIDDKVDVYAAWYDEGRITRCSDPDPTWATLAKKSIDTYRQIEEESNIKFYQEVGHLVVGSSEQAYMKNVLEVIEKNQIKDIKTFSGMNELKMNFPYANFQTGDKAPMGLLETQRAGHISPRKFVAAQCKIASSTCDCHIKVIRKIAVGIKPDEQDTSKWCIETKDSTNRDSKIEFLRNFDHCIISVGAWMNFRPLLYNDLKQLVHVNLQLMQTQVSKFEISLQESKKILNMPSIIYKDLESFWAYVLPPIEYPNGKIYIKIGGGYFNSPQKKVDNEEDLLRWYRSRGDPKLHEDICGFFRRLFPGINVLNAESDACITCHTKTKQLFIGPISGNTMSIACGGNGYAAKSADAIGKIACDMVLKCIFSDNSKTRQKEGEDILSSWNSACATIFEPEVFVP